MDCDRVFVLEDGEIIESGAPWELGRDPSTRFHALANQAVAV